MDVVTQVFDNYINRTIAYNISSHLGEYLPHNSDVLLIIKCMTGLITFATKPTLKQGITGAIENLRHALTELTPQGDTAMWDALKLAAECLNSYSANYPEAKKRLVCLSDGVDTNSKSKVWELCQEFQVLNLLDYALFCRIILFAHINRMLYSRKIILW